MTLVKLDETIYCLIHGCLHERDKNPWDIEGDECVEAEWRPIYWRARKADDPS